MNPFEKAVWAGFRFPYSGKGFSGNYSAEDLCNFPLQDLDALYRQLTKQLREAEGDSLLAQQSTLNDDLRVKIELVKSIVTTKLQQKQDAKDAKEKASQKQELLAALQARQREALSQLSEAELMAKIAELQ